MTISLVIGIFFVILFGKEEIHIFQNSHYNTFFDYFFRYATHFGDYYILLPITLLSLLVRWRYFVGFLLTGVLSLFAIVVLKQHIFIDYPRPPKHFEQIHELRLIEGVEILADNSFPSGHTTSAFAFYALMAFFISNRRFKFTLFLAAFLVGYSRIYLSQHFLIDVLVGSVLGTSIALLSYRITKLLKLPEPDRGLFKSLSKY